MRSDVCRRLPARDGRSRGEIQRLDHARPACAEGAVMSRIIEFPITEKPTTEEELDELHAEAFRDLEGHIGDCATMAEITSQFMANAKCTDERLAFSVFPLTEMLLNLKKALPRSLARWRRPHNAFDNKRS